MSEAESGQRRRVLALGLMALAAPNVHAAAPSARSWLLLYRPGPAWLPGQPLAQQPLREHGRYILSLYRAKIVRLAGGFADDSGGAALIEVDSADEAERIAKSDPAVTAGVLVCELIPWRLVDWDQYG